MTLTNEKLNLLFSYQPDDITRQLIEEKFAYSSDTPFFNIHEEFMLPANKMGNSSAVKTTVGRYLVNLFLFKPDGLNKIVGYINERFDKEVFNKNLSKITEHLLAGGVTPKMMASLIDRINWFGFGMSAYFASTISVNMIRPLKEIKKLKDKLIKDNQDSIDKKDAIVITKIGKQLISESKELLKNEEGMDLFNSGACKSFDNVYKNMCIMRGTIKDLDRPSGEYHIAFDNLMDGIEKENFHKYVDLSIQASYSRGVETAKGGYMFKKLCMAFQSVTLDENDKSDCKSKGFVEIDLTDFNKSFFHDRFIIEGSKLTLLTKENIKSYVGRRIKLRSPLFCVSPKLCSRCAGLLYYKMKIYNVGLATTKLGSMVQLMSMKKFHDTTIKTKKIDIFSKLQKK